MEGSSYCVGAETGPAPGAKIKAVAASPGSDLSCGFALADGARPVHRRTIRAHRALMKLIGEVEHGKRPGFGVETVCSHHMRRLDRSNSIRIADSRRLYDQRHSRNGPIGSSGRIAPPQIGDEDGSPVRSAPGIPGIGQVAQQRERDALVPGAGLLRAPASGSRHHSWKRATLSRTSHLISWFERDRACPRWPASHDPARGRNGVRGFASRCLAPRGRDDGRRASNQHHAGLAIARLSDIQPGRGLRNPRELPHGVGSVSGRPPAHCPISSPTAGSCSRSCGVISTASLEMAADQQGESFLRPGEKFLSEVRTSGTRRFEAHFGAHRFGGRK